MKYYLRKIIELVEQLPSGIDYDARPDDPSPDDLTAHTAGLIYQQCVKGLAELGEKPR